VLGLTEDGVDLEAGELTIAFQLQRVGGQLLHRETKTRASDDTMPLPEICRTALRERFIRRSRDRARASVAWQGSKLVFTTRFGTEIEQRNFNRSWDARIAKAGVPKITVHDARRTCGTLLVDLDVHPRVIMKVLRHANFNVTVEIYSQASAQVTREALKRLGRASTGSRSCTVLLYGHYKGHVHRWIVACELVDHTWLHTNCVPAAQGPIVVVGAIRSQSAVGAESIIRGPLVA
jgi:hypothetical protein